MRVGKEDVGSEIMRQSCVLEKRTPVPGMACCCRLQAALNGTPTAGKQHLLCCHSLPFQSDGVWSNDDGGNDNDG
jgi:hypothetical protein